VLLAALLMAIAPAGAPPVPIATVPPQAELENAIRRREAELFDLFFTGKCDLTRFRSMLADDLEFYHDNGGFSARNAEDFVAIFAKNCAERENPAAWRTRRQLVAGSLHIDPIPGWGAFEVGDHLFFEKHGVNGKETLAGKAKFAMVWVMRAQDWSGSPLGNHPLGHSPCDPSSSCSLGPSFRCLWLGAKTSAPLQ
jgi:hypothetical protein